MWKVLSHFLINRWGKQEARNLWEAERVLNTQNIFLGAKKRAYQGNVVGMPSNTKHTWGLWSWIYSETSVHYFFSNSKCLLRHRDRMVSSTMIKILPVQLKWKEKASELMVALKEWFKGVIKMWQGIWDDYKEKTGWVREWKSGKVTGWAVSQDKGLFQRGHWILKRVYQSPRILFTADSDSADLGWGLRLRFLTLTGDSNAEISRTPLPLSSKGLLAKRQWLEWEAWRLWPWGQNWEAWALKGLHKQGERRKRCWQQEGSRS